MESFKKSEITHYPFTQREHNNYGLIWTGESLHWRLLGAKDPMTAPELLDDYARDPYLMIRRSVARNPNTSEETLARLAMDSDARTRLFVVQNPHTTTKVLDKLLYKTECSVYTYRNAAIHPNVSGSILAMLAHQDDEIVRYNVARHPNTMNDTLSTLLEDPCESVRKMAAKKLEARLKASAKPTTGFYSKSVFA